MSDHDYAPEQALNLLMGRLREEDETLAEEMQAAIDAGQDISESEPIPNARQPREYRRTVPYAAEEALDLIVTALQAHLVEQPLFADLLLDNMLDAGLGELVRFIEIDSNIRGQGLEKRVEVEIRTETQISPSDTDTLPMTRIERSLIEEQLGNIAHLRSLLDFSGDSV